MFGGRNGGGMGCFGFGMSFDIFSDFDAYADVLGQDDKKFRNAHKVKGKRR